MTISPRRVKLQIYVGISQAHRPTLYGRFGYVFINHETRYRCGILRSYLTHDNSRYGYL